MTDNRTALDVWLKFDSDDDDEPTYEANTFALEDGTYCVEWYHSAVGKVSHEWFGTYRGACSWYERHGYQDFSC